MLRVALFEKHELLRQLLSDIITSAGRYELVVATADVNEFKAQVEACADIAIAVLGVVGDEDGGCGLLLWLRKLRPAVRNLVLGLEAKQARTERAVNGGAACVLCNRAGPKEVGTALEKLSVPGGTYFDHLVQEVYRPAAPAANGTARKPAEEPTVSDAEMRVLKVVLKPGAATDKEIAQLLDLSPATVRSHLRRLYEAFGVSGRQGLIDKARSQGYHLL
jgi:DNA-binding NarL/FixJ family response regulator